MKITHKQVHMFGVGMGTCLYGFRFSEFDVAFMCCFALAHDHVRQILGEQCLKHWEMRSQSKAHRSMGRKYRKTNKRSTSRDLLHSKCSEKAFHLANIKTTYLLDENKPCEDPEKRQQHAKAIDNHSCGQYRVHECATSRMKNGRVFTKAIQLISINSESK